MMTTLKSMGQSVQSLGNKAVAYPHWAGKAGYAALTLTLVVLCGIAAVIGGCMYLLVMLLKGSNANADPNFKLYDALAEEQAAILREQERLVEMYED